jgi:MFS superfamily sulfate permease-like transporter
LAIFAVVNFPGILSQFGIKFQPDMDILQFIMVYNIFLSLSICLWSVFWIYKDNIAGIQTGTTVGVLLFIVGTSVFIRFNKLDILLVDSVRALLMIIFGVLAYLDCQSHFEHIRKIADHKNIQTVVIRMRDVFYVDIDGKDTLGESIEYLLEHGKTVLLSSVNPQVSKVIRRNKLVNMLFEESKVFTKTADALKYLNFNDQEIADEYLRVEKQYVV